jgi:hypothetical protein
MYGCYAIDYDYDLHIVNFSILYLEIVHSYGDITITDEHIKNRPTYMFATLPSL